MLLLLSIIIMHVEIMFFKSHIHLPGANELTRIGREVGALSMINEYDPVQG